MGRSESIGSAREGHSEFTSTVGPLSSLSLTLTMGQSMGLPRRLSSTDAAEGDHGLTAPEEEAWAGGSSLSPLTLRDTLQGLEEIERWVNAPDEDETALQTPPSTAETSVMTEMELDVDRASRAAFQTPRPQTPRLQTPLEKEETEDVVPIKAAHRIHKRPQPRQYGMRSTHPSPLFVDPSRRERAERWTPISPPTPCPRGARQDLSTKVEPDSHKAPFKQDLALLKPRPEPLRLSSPESGRINHIQGHNKEACVDNWRVSARSLSPSRQTTDEASCKGGLIRANKPAILRHLSGTPRHISFEDRERMDGLLITQPPSTDLPALSSAKPSPLKLRNPRTVRFDESALTIKSRPSSPVLCTTPASPLAKPTVLPGGDKLHNGFTRPCTLSVSGPPFPTPKSAVFDQKEDQVLINPGDVTETLAGLKNQERGEKDDETQNQALIASLVARARSFQDNWNRLDADLRRFLDEAEDSLETFKYPPGVQRPAKSQGQTRGDASNGSDREQAKRSFPNPAPLWTWPFAV